MVFCVNAMVNSPSIEGEGSGVVVDESRLVRFLQYLSQNPAREQALARLEALTPAQRRQLIDAYVREEVLHREARALGLDKNDQAIRQRLVQQMRLLLEASAVDGAATELQLRAYFLGRQADYAVPPAITFTHIFFSHKRHGGSGAKQKAEQLKRELNQQATAFDDATRHGDRFAFHRNYVDRSPDDVAGHFGQSMAEQVFALEVRDDRWQGPLISEYGAHLLLVVKRQPGYLPEFNDVITRVASDYRFEQRQQQMRKAEARLVSNYRIEQCYPPPQLVSGNGPCATVADQ